MKTVIGIDYGTLSARAVMVDTRTGEVLCSHQVAYAHGVMPGDLASAADYEQALAELLCVDFPCIVQDGKSQQNIIRLFVLDWIHHLSPVHDCTF